MTDLDTAALRALLVEATPGPYRIVENWIDGHHGLFAPEHLFDDPYVNVADCTYDIEEGGRRIDDTKARANARLLAAAANALPALLADAERLQRVRALLDELETRYLGVTTIHRTTLSVVRDIREALA